MKESTCGHEGNHEKVGESLHCGFQEESRVIIMGELERWELVVMGCLKWKGCRGYNWNLASSRG